jgi:hypothetical protein
MNLSDRDKKRLTNAVFFRTLHCHGSIVNVLSQIGCLPGTALFQRPLGNTLLSESVVAAPKRATQRSNLTRYAGRSRFENGLLCNHEVLNTNCYSNRTIHTNIELMYFVI